MHAGNGQENDRTADAQVVAFLAVSGISVSSVVDCSGRFPGVTWLLSGARQRVLLQELVRLRVFDLLPTGENHVSPGSIPGNHRQTPPLRTLKACYIHLRQTVPPTVDVAPLQGALPRRFCPIPAMLAGLTHCGPSDRELGFPRSSRPWANGAGDRPGNCQSEERAAAVFPVGCSGIVVCRARPGGLRVRAWYCDDNTTRKSQIQPDGGEGCSGMQGIAGNGGAEGSVRRSAHSANTRDDEQESG